MTKKSTDKMALCLSGDIIEKLNLLAQREHKVFSVSFAELYETSTVTFESRHVDKRVEQNPDYVQLIPYILVFDESVRMLSYRRGSGGNDARIYSKKSIGIGGHIEPMDHDHDVSTSAPIEDVNVFIQIVLNSILREVKEEIGLETIADEYFSLDMATSLFASNHNRMACLYSTENEVSKVHLGLVIPIVISNDQKETLVFDESEITEVEWLSREEITDLSGFESWSAIVLKSLGDEECQTN